VADYRITAASGTAGPKLREGDRQVPEGIYRIVGLNPNSRYHLSMKLDYPNAFDRHQAARDGRARPGSDIFIPRQGGLRRLPRRGRRRHRGAVRPGGLESARAILRWSSRRSTAGRCRFFLLPRDCRHGRRNCTG